MTSDFAPEEEDHCGSGAGAAAAEANAGLPGAGDRLQGLSQVQQRV
jgi:hypothetical protein